ELIQFGLLENVWKNLNIPKNNFIMSSLKIDETKAFAALEPMVKKMVLKRVNRVGIEDEIIIARTIGLDKWKAQTGLQERWKTIVVEIIKLETDDTTL
ncbi:hypothetical protein, partial [Flavobacterium sp.]|uniref:hypothetical protein n=1 Tax=Flavobacterium sp. TaxID=239 RepID=UPI0025D14C7D